MTICHVHISLSVISSNHSAKTSESIVKFSFFLRLAYYDFSALRPILTRIQMETPWKLYLTCGFLGAAVHPPWLFLINAADYFNYFFSDDYKQILVYGAVAAGVSASLVALIMESFQLKPNGLTSLSVTLPISAVMLAVQMVVTPLFSLPDEVRFGCVLAANFVTGVLQGVGRTALLDLLGKFFPTFGFQAADLGSTFGLLAIFISRCISKASFEHLGDKSQGFRLSGYLYVAVVDLVIVVAWSLIAFVLRSYVKRLDEENARLPLLLSNGFSYVSRKNIISNNWAVLTTIFLTEVMYKSIFPVIISQFHGNYNCTSHLGNISVSPDNSVISSGLQSSDRTGWFMVKLVGCWVVTYLIGLIFHFTRFRINYVYSKKTILFNCLVQFVFSIPVLLIYFKPCVRGLQADWLAYLSVILVCVVTAYGLATTKKLLTPRQSQKKREETMTNNIAYMFLEGGNFVGFGFSLFLVVFVFEKTKP